MQPAKPSWVAALGDEPALHPRECVYRSVSRLARVVTVTYDAALKPCGLSAGQFTTLMTLAMQGPCSVGHLAEAIASSPSTIPRIIEPLVAAGWMKSRPGEDRRVRQLAISASGLNKLRTALPHWERGQAAVLERFNETRWTRLRRELSSLRHVLSE